LSDVFISYAREDRERAHALAQALESRGLTVWWDRVIPAGRQFDEVIEQELDASRCAVVLWSADSAASKWVKAEAGEALQQDKLVPALLDTTLRLPLEFRRVQAADLSSWRVGQPSPALDAFCAEVAAAVAKAATTMRTHTRARKAASPVPPPLPPHPPAPPQPAGDGHKRWLWLGVAAAALVIVVAAVMEAGEGSDGLAQPPGDTRPGPAAGFDQVLRWRDYVLNYEGRLQWDGRTTVGTLAYRALDSGSGLAAAQGTITALRLPDSGQRLVFHAQIPVPAGDSRTAGAHTHAVNLIFESRGGGWAFVGNCMALDRPDLCWR
jgi:TIR domain